jgi:hypothetical protein
MASSLVQYLLARNGRRRMDFALSGGFVGVGLVVLGVVILLVERAWLAADEEERSQRAFIASRASGGASVAAGAVLTVVPSVLVASANSYHRPDCLLAAGRDGLEAVDADEAQARGLSACRLCLKELA